MLQGGASLKNRRGSDVRHPCLQRLLVATAVAVAVAVSVAVVAAVFGVVAIAASIFLLFNIWRRIF